MDQYGNLISVHLRAIASMAALVFVLALLIAPANSAEHRAGPQLAQTASPFIGRWTSNSGSGGPVVFDITEVHPNGHAAGKFTWRHGTMHMTLSDKTSGVEMIVKIEGSKMTGLFSNGAKYELTLQDGKLVGVWKHPNGWSTNHVFSK